MHFGDTFEMAENDEDDEDDDDDFFKNFSFMREIDYACRYPKTRGRYPLHETFERISRYRHSLHVLMPEEVHRHDVYSYINEYMWMSSELVEEYAMPHYESKLRKKSRLREGSIDFPDQTHVTIRPGIRRYARPSEQTITYGIYLQQFSTPEHSPHSVEARFHTDFVEPHVRGTPADDPFEWAHRRIKIALGATENLGGISGPYLESLYTGMASTVCNTETERLFAPRTFETDASTRQMLTKAFGFYEDCLSPELVWILLEYKYLFTYDTVTAPAYQTFFHALPVMLANGLIVDRLFDLAHLHETHGATPEEALHHGLKVVQSIYAGNKPWWFKEDMDLTALYHAATQEQDTAAVPMDAEGRQLMEDITSHAGFASGYALQIYQENGWKLLHIPGIDRRTMLRILAEITTWYGIGNHKRACNIVTIVERTLQDTPEQERYDMLEKIENHLEQERPTSEIIGRLEGEGDFAKPGLRQLLGTLQGKEALVGLESSIDLSEEHLRTIQRGILEPVSNRAHKPPALNTRDCPSVSVSSFIPVSAQTHTALLTDERLNAVQTPTVNLFSFYEQMRRECTPVRMTAWQRTQAVDYESIANVYFSFCAHKFEHPFSPPPGFLTFLQKFGSVPHFDDTLDYDDPNHSRHLYEEDFQKAYVERDMVPSHLLDLWIMGTLSWEKLWEICQWMTEDLDEYSKAEIADATYREKMSEHMHRRFRFEEDYPKLQQKIRKLQNRITNKEQNQKPDQPSLYDLRRQLHDATEQLRYMEEDKTKWCEFSQEEADDHTCVNINKQEDRLRFPRVEKLQLALAAFKECRVLIHLDIACAQKIWQLLEEQIFRTDEHVIPTLAKNIFANPDSLNTPFVDTNTILQKVLQCSTLGHLSDIFRQIESLLLAIARCSIASAEHEEMLIHALKTSLHRHCLPDSIIHWKEEGVDKLKKRLESAPFTHPIPDDELLAHFYPTHSDIMRYLTIAKYTHAFHEQYLHTAGENDTDEDIQRNMRRTAAISIRTAQTIFGLHILDQTALPAHMPTAVPVQAVLSIRQGENTTTQLQQLQQALPDMYAHLDSIRTSHAGLVSVGGKIHLHHAVNENKMAAVSALLGLEGTNFHLIHANTCLLLPAMPTADELKMLIFLLEREGVIDNDYPEMQIGIPGRLPPVDCALLGSVLLLATQRGIAYKEGAFNTTHESTGSRMMAYDAGGTRVKFPYATYLPGRTDILGRRHPEDITLFQIVGTLLLHAKAGGAFHPIGTAFKEEYLTLLKRHALDDVINDEWVFSGQSRTDNALSQKHFADVKRCTDAYFSCKDTYQAAIAAGTDPDDAERGIIFDVRNLIDTYIEKIRIIQNTAFVPASMPEQSSPLVHV